MRSLVIGIVSLSLLVAGPGPAQEDAEGCQDHPLFTRFPGFHLSDCQSSRFDLRAFPVGPPNEEQLTAVVEVEGPVQWLSYELDDGATAPSGLQIMRNFENAARSAGGTVEGKYPGWCEASYDDQRMPRMGNGCTSYGLTLKFLRGGTETWVFLQADSDEGSYYLLTVSERESMKQDVAVNEMADKLATDGFVTLHVNFDTGTSTIRPDSAKTLDDAAAALELAGDLLIEVGGHTDNTGTPDGNQQLSEDRARAVMAELVQRGIPAERLEAKGYGQTVPIADNRTEEGRAANRRVELTTRR